MSKPATSQLIEDRIAQLGSWLDDQAPFACCDQRHLDPGTPEQAYWHLGYAAALKDALALIESTSGATGALAPDAPGDA